MLLARQFRQDANRAQTARHSFLSHKLKAEFDWDGEKWRQTLEKNHGLGGNLKFCNGGKYRFAIGHKLRELLSLFDFQITIFSSGCDGFVYNGCQLDTFDRAICSDGQLFAPFMPHRRLPKVAIQSKVGRRLHRKRS